MATDTSHKIVLVTGANKGLGYAIISTAGTRNPSSSYHYILACRDREAGAKAMEDLKRDGVAATLELLELDVTNDADIISAVDSVTAKHGRLDILVNNAGIAKFPADATLPALRSAYTAMFDVNVASVACLSAAFQPLLAESSHPKVINITSGLGSIANSLTKRMARFPPYGTSKVAVNGLTAHLQAVENDRIGLAKGSGGTAIVGPQINYYSVAPGFLKTALTRFNEMGKDPLAGAEVVVQLITDDEYPGGTQWEFVEGKMQEVPW